MNDEWKERVGYGFMVLLMGIGIGSCSFLEQLGRNADIHIEIVRPVPHAQEVEATEL